MRLRLAVMSLLLSYRPTVIPCAVHVGFYLPESIPLEFGGITLWPFIVTGFRDMEQPAIVLHECVHIEKLYTVDEYIF